MRTPIIYIAAFLLTAVAMVAGCGSNGADMRAQLEELERCNRADSLMTNDSLALVLTNYFDRHGTPNEQMRAYYILGRTYYLLGEFPRAMEMYDKAADCADTTSADCEYKVLSRVHAQNARIFHQQIQARSQLQELRLAEYYAWKGKDTVQAIECFAQQANAYDFLNRPDSVAIIKEKASNLFKTVGRENRAAQTLASAISPLINSGQLEKARYFSMLYENYSGLFDSAGNIEKGREIYYYSKGLILLTTHQLDSAEYYFRKELRDGKDLNNQIAGCKGLQKLFEVKRIPDSIAKYANLGYLLNDSAYSLAEMQNIQRFQASYNYNHQKQLAERSKRDAEQSKIIFISFSVVIMLVGAGAFSLYRTKKQKKLEEYRRNLDVLGKIQSELQELCGEDADVPALIARKNDEINQLQSRIFEYQERQLYKDKAELEDRLNQSAVVLHLNELLKGNPIQLASREDIRQLTNLINEEIPVFYRTLNNPVILRPVEYEICMLIRCHFKPSAVAKLLNLDEAYVSNTRRRVLRKLYGINGNPKDLDERIMEIV